MGMVRQNLLLARLDGFQISSLGHLASHADEKPEEEFSPPKKQESEKSKIHCSFREKEKSGFFTFHFFGSFRVKKCAVIFFAKEKRKLKKRRRALQMACARRLRC